MPEKANATSGQLVASRTVSTNGNGAHAHDSTVWAAGDHAIWRNADHDLPVVIAGLAGEHAGVRYYSVEGSSTGIPEHELLREQAASVLGAANSNRTQLDDLRALAEAARLEPPANETATPKSDEHTEYLLRAGLSDEGNAQCVTRLYAGQFLHSEALGWLAYTGTHWATDGAEARLDRAIVDTLLARIRATWQHSADDDDDGDDSFERRLRAFCNPNKGRVEGAKHLLRSLVHVEPAEFDAEPDMLNCRNGVLDLRSGKLIAHEPAQRFMHCSSIPIPTECNFHVRPSAGITRPARGVVVVGLRQAARVAGSAGYIRPHHPIGVCVVGKGVGQFRVPLPFQGVGGQNLRVPVGLVDGAGRAHNLAMLHGDDILLAGGAMLPALDGRGGVMVAGEGFGHPHPVDGNADDFGQTAVPLRFECFHLALRGLGQLDTRLLRHVRSP
jgi:hypothetical protein